MDTVQVDANSFGSPVLPSPSFPQLYAGFLLVTTVPNLSWLGIGTVICWVVYPQCLVHTTSDIVYIFMKLVVHHLLMLHNV